MASFLIEYYSEALHRRTSFRAIIPNEKSGNMSEPMKTIFYLHGYSGCSECNIPEEILENLNAALISPTGENSFYVDGPATGHKYETMIAVELVDYVRKTFGLAKRPEDTYITGISMGGYGSLHIGLKYPDRFGKIGAMSSALIIPLIAAMQPGDENQLGNYEYYREIFGEPLSNIKNSSVDPEAQIIMLKGKGVPIPDIFVSCGKEDIYFIEANRKFHSFLQNNGVQHAYLETCGGHDSSCFNESMTKAMEWMFAEKMKARPADPAR